MNVNMFDGSAESVSFAKAMADETRQRVMGLLCCRWLCVGDIVEEMHGITQPTVSHHLAILREAGLVHVRREGKQVFYSLNQDEVVDCCGRIMRVFAPERADPREWVGPQEWVEASATVDVSTIEVRESPTE